MPEIAPKRSLCRLLSRVFPDFCGVTNGFTAGKISESSFTACQRGEKEETIKDDFKKSHQLILEVWGQVLEQDRTASQVKCAWVGEAATGYEGERWQVNQRYSKEKGA